MKDKAVLWSGIIGLVVTTVCCLAPSPILVAGAAGMSIWLAGYGYILLPALILILAATACGRFHRHRHKEDN